MKLDLDAAHGTRRKRRAASQRDCRQSVQTSLAQRYGPGLNVTFAENPALIGGLRMKVGSDVYDGSVQARLAALEAKFLRQEQHESTNQTFDMSNIYLQEIEAQIAGVKTVGDQAERRHRPRNRADGVAKIEGLTDAMLNEMLDFGNGVTGLALNLEETEVGAIILGDYSRRPRRPGGQDDRQVALRARGQGIARPRGEHARPAD